MWWPAVATSDGGWWGRGVSDCGGLQLRGLVGAMNDRSMWCVCAAFLFIIFCCCYLEALKVVNLVAGVLVEDEDVGADAGDDEPQVELRGRGGGEGGWGLVGGHGWCGV